MASHMVSFINRLGDKVSSKTLQSVSDNTHIILYLLLILLVIGNIFDWPTAFKIMTVVNGIIVFIASIVTHILAGFLRCKEQDPLSVWNR